MRAYSLLVLALLLVLAAGKRSCRVPQVFQNFDIKRIWGKWYEYSRYEHDFQKGCECSTMEIYARNDSNAIDFFNCCQLPSFSNETRKCDIGLKQAHLKHPKDEEAYFRYIRFGSLLQSRFWIPFTDYKNYMFVSGCDHVSSHENKEIFWVMTRKKKVEKSIADEIDKFLKAFNFDESRIIRQTQTRDICTTEKPKRRNRRECKKRLFRVRD